ncbi:hypothetical protein AB0P32_10405 [Streptomyces sp. NPDC085995]|uniref:hypothetical protein n=1 Tax=Streptomyces sp. NPDC085995 TaxID=3154861 RepID=UPI003448D186
MPLFGKKNRRPVSNQPLSLPPLQLQTRTPSPIMNILGRELNAALPQEKITELRSASAVDMPTTGDRERLRACMALDWLVRTWVPRWLALVPDAGEQLGSALIALAPIRDLETADAAGALIGALADVSDSTEKFIAANYDKDNFYDTAAVTAARKASDTAVAESAGTAVADAAMSEILDECTAARTDIALRSVTVIALNHSLDTVWPYMVNWANGPGDFDVKKISVGNLAPVVARKALESVIGELQLEAGKLYVELCRLD